MEDLPAATPASPFEGYNISFATCTLRERTDRVSSQTRTSPSPLVCDECGIGAQRTMSGKAGNGERRYKCGMWNDRGGIE